MPEVLVAVHIDHATPFMEDFFDRLSNLTYPKNKMDIFIYYAVSCTYIFFLWVVFLA